MNSARRVAIERCAKAVQQPELQRQALLWASCGAACSALAFLIRSIGLGIIVVVLLYLLKHRLYKLLALGLTELSILILLAITVLWPFRPFRFVLPLLPWAIFYFLRAISSWWKRRERPTAPRQWHVALEALVLLSVINLWSNGSYIVTLHGAPEQRPQWVRMFDENEKLIGWLKDNVPPDAVIAGQNPALVNLYTGIKGVGSTEPSRNWERWKQLQVRYLVLTSYFVFTEFSPAEKRFREVYRTPVAKMRVLDFGDPATRPDWVE